MTAPSLYLHFRALGRPFLWAAYFSPPLAKIRPGNPAPAMGPGTEAGRNAISAVMLATPTTLLAAMVKRAVTE